MSDQKPDDMAETFLIQEGGTQGYPLTMVVYYLGILPITWQLK